MKCSDCICEHIASLKRVGAIIDKRAWDAAVETSHTAITVQNGNAVCLDHFKEP